jgi:sterol desaturase/sphingolipid hydroxylase (fatty acid hydroxylase superfamily)
VSNLLLYSIPGFLALLVLEALWTRRLRREARGGILGYERRDTLASLAMGVGNVIISAFTTLGAVALWSFAHQHRLLSLGEPLGWWSWLALFLLEDLCYYWFHRSHHQVRLLWAAHVNHHTSQYFNLSTALRQPWFTPITGPIFWLPLALLGFSPPQILSAQALSLIYQFWIHTETIRRLPRPLEWLLNTPSHHRVHHGKNVRYLDRNHGGVLIIWDRLFGTFAAENEADPARYGVTHDLSTFNPLRIAVHEFADIARDVRRATSPRAVLGYLFAPPGWSPDGSSLTARQLRERLPVGDGCGPSYLKTPLARGPAPAEARPGSEPACFSVPSRRRAYVAREIDLRLVAELGAASPSVARPLLEEPLALVAREARLACGARRLGAWHAPRHV